MLNARAKVAKFTRSEPTGQEQYAAKPGRIGAWRRTGLAEPQKVCCRPCHANHASMSTRSRLEQRKATPRFLRCSSLCVPLSKSGNERSNAFPLVTQRK